MIPRCRSALCALALSGVLSVPGAIQASQNRAPDNSAANKQDGTLLDRRLIKQRTGILADRDIIRN